jgi:hypothetical protein
MNSHKHLNRGLLSLLFLLFITGILRGQTQYIGNDNGDWETASNWNNGLPSSTNPPTITGGKMVTINANLTVDYLIQNFGTILNKGTITISTGNLSSGGALQNSGILNIGLEGSLTSSGGMLNSGTVDNKGNVTSNSPWTNTATGVLNNSATFQQLAPLTNEGIVSNKEGVFTCPQVFTNNKTVENLAGATFKIDFGGSFTNDIGSSLANGGNFQILSSFINNTTVFNTGYFINNGILTCNGVFNNESNARFESSATVNLSGAWHNKALATTQSGFRFNILANGVFNNTGTFQNLDQIDVKQDGRFNNETGATTNLLFGASILNAGIFTINTASSIISNGTINNAKILTVLGTIESNDGSQIINSDVFNIGGLVKIANILTNNGVLTLDGSLENNAGGTVTNTATMTVTRLGKLSNSSHFFNRIGGDLTNNGSFFNIVDITNEGVFTNNAFLSLAGDLFNKARGSFNNTEVVEIRDGSIVNEGGLTNGKTLIVRACGILSNKTILTNNGRIENSGVVFQRGTLAANPIVNLGGLIQVGTSAAAPSVCKPTVLAGTDLLGRAKVDAPAIVTKGFGIDSCFGIQYFVDGVNRRTYLCPDVGGIFTVPVKLVFRTGDSLTCSTKITVFDGVAPKITNCPEDVTVFNTAKTAPYSWATIAATDNCGGTPTIASTVVSGSQFNLGTTEVIITAKDATNNLSECRFKVTVVQVFSTTTCTAPDVTAPIFAACPANITLNTSGSGAFAAWNTPSVTDACYPIVLKVSQASGSYFPSGLTTVTYYATDANKNTATCSFTVTVNGAADLCANDNIKPIIRNCPPNFFGASNTAINGAVALWQTPLVSDNCGSASLTSTAQSGSIFPNGTTAVVYTATDVKGNISTCTFNIFIGIDPCPSDGVGPSLTCPADISVNSTTQSGIATWITPTPTDACGGITLVSTHTLGSSFALGATVVTYQASDKKGNSSTCSFKVTVVNPCLSDVTNPVISACPANATLSTTGATTTATWIAPTATDNCTIAALTSTHLSGATFGLGVSTVTYKATDLSGNSAICSFNLTVNAVVQTVIDPNKCYKIVNKTTGKALDVEAGAAANFARIFQWTLHGGANQQWQLTKLANGFYEIKNRKSDKLLDIVGSGVNCANGIKTEQYINDNTGSQQWNLLKQADGSFKILNKTCNKTLDVAGGNTLDGAAVEINDDSGAEYFKWLIIETPCAQTICTTNGGLIHERWTNRIPTWATPIQVPTTAPNSLSMTTPTDFKMPIFNAADNYISRARGYVKPTVSGAYVFNVTGDDYTELWLSTTNRSTNISKIAHHYGYTGVTEYTKYPTQTSVSINLQAGQLYYIELRHFEGGGGDFYQVQWKKPDATTFSIIPSANLMMPCSSTQQAALSSKVFTFEAKTDFSQAKLQWISNGGDHNDYFKVERLNLSGVFETLETVNAHTNDAVLQTYNFTDSHPWEGENQYRITTIPIEGSPQYSDIKKLVFGKMGDITVFPNPANEYLDIDLRLYENKTVSIYLYNALGKMVKKTIVEHASVTPQHLDIQDLNTGSYLIRVQTEGKRDVLKQVKIVK